LRMPCQEKVVQMICETLKDTEAELKRVLHEKEAELGRVNTECAERETATSKTEAALKAACETVFTRTERLRKDARTLKKVNDDLEEGNKSLDVLGAKIAKVEAKRQRITDVMAQSYTPLRDASVEAQLDTKRLLKTVIATAKDLEFESSLLAIMPTALDHDPTKRGSLGSLALRQFEDGIADRLAEFDEDLGSLTSAKIEQTNLVENAREPLNAAKTMYEASLTALKQAQTEKGNAQATHDTALLKVQSGPLERDDALAACEEARLKLIAFQTGPLVTFHELEERVVKAPISLADEVPVDGVFSVGVGVDAGSTPEPAELEQSKKHTAGDDDQMVVCQNFDAGETAEMQKSEEMQKHEEIQKSKMESGEEKMETLESMPPELSAGVVPKAQT